MSESHIPLSGKLVKAVIGSFCQKPIQGDDTWEHMSIGVAENSVVATDTSSAIMIGQDNDGHVATQRKEALLESERASLYGDPVRIDEIDRNCDPETGEAKPMPHIRAHIRKQLAGMKPIATVNPTALLAIAKVANAAGAMSVELLQPEGDPAALGFRFKFSPEEGHVNLFSEWEGDVEARGLFVVQKSLTRIPVAIEPEDEESEGETPAPASTRRSRRVSVSISLAHPEDPDDAAAPEPEPLPPLDLDTGIERDGYALPALRVVAPDVQPEEPDAGDYGPKILETLRAFNMTARIAAVHTGPTVTLYELDIPQGTAVKRVSGLADDLQLQLGVRSVRIMAPIPGKKAVGIELPNKQSRRVDLGEVCARREFTEAEAPLTMALGLDTAGAPVYCDLASTPHLLIAGATNSGKSIGVASMLSSLLMRNTPKEMRLVLIDPKQVELSLFEGVPHLACPVITDTKEAPGVLRAVVREMELRYDKLKEAGVRNIAGWNAKASFQDRMPYFVVVIDELADLMMQARAEVETSIVRLAQKARAVGIHLIVATQRPSVDVITGLIKANIPSRIAYSVASQIDSRVILDENGAEKLLGRGDMLFKPVDASRVVRLQGAYIGEEGVAAVCQSWKGQGISMTHEIIVLPDHGPEDVSEPGELYDEAVIFVRERGQVSTSMLQRRFSIGFMRAKELVDRMEADGIVGPHEGPRPRKVLEVATGG